MFDRDRDRDSDRSALEAQKTDEGRGRERDQEPPTCMLRRPTWTYTQGGEGESMVLL